MMSAIKNRFGYHPNQQPDAAAETAPVLAKSSSSPDLFLKSAPREKFFPQSSSWEDKSSKPDDCEATPGPVGRSFEFREDPNFWKEHSVQVIIRLRPLSSSELSVQGQSRCVRQDSSQAITWAGPPESRFTFDLVADENVSQEMLFKVAGVSLVENCMEGYNSCMFAYGQTGSGKTHTMLGDIEGGTRRHSVNCGMTPRVFEYLFSRIQKDKDARREEKLRFTCKCSFLEIYNEQILDLLDPSSANLQIREDNKKGIYVENITEVEVTSARDVIQQLIQGSANRKVAATNMNRASSRSHSVFTCIIESKWDSQGVTHHRFARLNLVDLAGSERQKSSGAEGERLKEATNINKSLSTLGLVIMNLVSISNGKPVHVPYRDSKLTFLLQDSLGGNAKTIIIANISPSNGCSLETLGTLKFAQRAKFIKNHAIVNEDASGDVLALRIENQNLKKEVSRLRILANGGAERNDTDVLSSITFSGSPGSFKWEGHHGFSSPIISEKRTPHLRKKEYEVALVGVLRREKDKDTALQALATENQATLQLAKQREDEIQGLKMRLRFREAGIKRLEGVASGKISAETHLLNEREEHLKEIEVLRAQVDRNQEVTRFAMENLRLKEDIRRLKSFCEEGERERLNEQIMILENKLLEALDWKLMHESDPANIKKESHQSDSDFLISNQESASPWETSTNEETEFLRMQAIQNQSELDSLHKRLDFIVKENEKLERHVSDLAKELEAERLSKETIAEDLHKGQTKLSSLITIGQSDQSEIKTMVDAIASASQREAEAHEMAVFLSKENDELRTKLKVLIEDNNKLIDLYESAVSGNRTNISVALSLSKAVEEKELEMKGDIERLNSQLAEMHEENDKLLSMYENAMQERDELKIVIASGQREGKGDPEKLLEIDRGQCLSFNDASNCFENKLETEESDSTVLNLPDRNIEPATETIGESLCEKTSLYDVHVGDDYSQRLIEEFIEPHKQEDSCKSADKATECDPESPMDHLDMSNDLNSMREKLFEAQEKLSNAAQNLSMFGLLERAMLDVDALSEKIEKLELRIQAEKLQREYLKSVSSEMRERRDLACNKLSDLNHSLGSFTSSSHYLEQREVQAKSRLDTSSNNLSRQKEEMNGLELSRNEVTNALLRHKDIHNELRNKLQNLRSKLEEENRKVESERVLFAIDNSDNRNWQVSGKATALLRSEEEKTKLLSEIKLNKDKLGDVRKESDVLTKKLGRIESEIIVLEVEMQKEIISVEEMNLEVENIVKEKVMVLENRENTRDEFERTLVEYYERMFEVELKEEELNIVHEEVLMEFTEMEGLWAAKDKAVRRKTEVLELLSCETCSVSEKVEADVRSVRASVVELNALLG